MWTTPRTWNPGEVVTASLMNVHVRDNLNVLKTEVDDEGRHTSLIAGFAFSSGQGNGAGGSDTQLTSYDVTIAPDTLNEPGDHLIVEGTFACAANTNAKTAKLQIDSATLVTIVSNNVASEIIPFRMILRRRASNSGSITGTAEQGAADGGNPTARLTNQGLGTVDWTAAQTLKVYAAANGANDIRLTDYSVRVERSLAGVTV